MIGEALKGHLDLLILAVLAGGPAHGYALIETLRQRSCGLFDLPEGTVYPALHRLEEQGLLASRWSNEGARRRRVYQLTPKGLQALTRRREEWRQFASAVDATAGT
jgi:PadR family transcriptional regulator PadR